MDEIVRKSVAMTPIMAREMDEIIAERNRNKITYGKYTTNEAINEALALWISTEKKKREEKS